MKVGHSNRILGLKSFLRSSALEQFGKCLYEERYENARDASGSDHALFEAATETRRKQCKKRGERFTAKSESTTSDAAMRRDPSCLLVQIKIGLWRHGHASCVVPSWRNAAITPVSSRLGFKTMALTTLSSQRA